MRKNVKRKTLKTNTGGSKTVDGKKSKDNQEGKKDAGQS